VVRIIAFVAGVAAGVALLLFVIASISVPAPVSASGSPTFQARQESGKIFTHPDDLQGMPAPGDEDEPDEGAQMDLEGDQVTPALAKYRFDAQGNIYETHAPHTEVPHLGSPIL
jgi:hypothetical protein